MLTALSIGILDRRLLGEGEVALVDHPDVKECLRIKTIARYNPEEDEFEARSVFCSGALKADGQPADVPRAVRQLFGFIYLRALRTGSRALSLERGSLLDIILQQRKVRTGIWENAIEQLRALDPPIDSGAANLVPILTNIEKRLGQYLPLNSGERITTLFVSELSREHLRKTISFFLRPESGQEPVPFRDVGAGTLNVLVLALLSFIAESKKNKVVFAMEEPEIAVPPHTQRRIVNYLLSATDQCFITSHSPYVIERFDPDQIRILRKDANATVIAKELRVGDTLKSKTYRRQSRHWFAETMLGRGVIIGEGITEKDIIDAAARKLEAHDPAQYYPLDLSGVSTISVDGDGALAEVGEFFFDLGIPAYAFFDSKPLTADAKTRIDASYVLPCQTPYSGAETLLVEECPIGRLWQLLEELRDSGEKPNLVPVGPMLPANEVKEIAKSLLRKNKGEGYAGRLIDLCGVTELPATILSFMQRVYHDFEQPEPVPVFEEDSEIVEKENADGSAGDAPPPDVSQSAGASQTQTPVPKDTVK